jgi:hypothetical protein
MPIVGCHALIDFFATSSYSLKLHHLCIFGIILYNYYYNVLSSDRFIFIYPLLKTEISSIFYAAKYYLPKNTFAYTINNLLFYTAFAKFRIWDYYYEILYLHGPFNMVIQKYSQTDNILSSILILSCYGLYILNIYWFLILNKILYKTVVTKMSFINTDQMCHLLCSYIHWINIPVCIYLYSYNPQPKYMFDMIGITSLSISSYLYHYDIYSRLSNKTIDCYIIPTMDNIVLFFDDNIFIQIRSLLTVFTNYYNTKYFTSIALFSKYISFGFYIQRCIEYHTVIV